MTGDSVQVDPKGLIQYGEAVLNKVAQAQGPSSDAITNISQNAIAAFGTSSGTSGTFAEGLTALRVMSRNLKDAEAFLKDVTTGMQAIDSAANTMAVMYATTDADQANSLNAVDFAFATGTAPAGFPKTGVSTMFDQEQAALAASGANTSAAFAAQDSSFLQFATSQTAVPGGTMYTFADGSKLAVVNTASGSSFYSQNATVTSVYRPGQDKPATISRNTTGYDYSGQRTTSTSSETLNTDGTYTSSSQSTTILNDGRVSVTTSTDSGNGKPQNHTVVVTPRRPDPSDTPTSQIEQYEAQYDTQGSQDNMKYGRN